MKEERQAGNRLGRGDSPNMAGMVAVSSKTISGKKPAAPQPYRAKPLYWHDCHLNEDSPVCKGKKANGEYCGHDAECCRFYGCMTVYDAEDVERERKDTELSHTIELNQLKGEIIYLNEQRNSAEEKFAELINKHKEWAQKIEVI